MLFETEIDIEASPDQVFALIVDAARVGPCLPGASIDALRDDGRYDGQLAVKLGPVNLRYQGIVGISESDAAAHTATMLARGNGVRIPGTAAATLRMTVAERSGGGSRLTVASELVVTGRVAQMGQGVMREVAARMFAETAANIRELLDATDAASADGIEAGSANAATPDAMRQASDGT